MMKGFSLGALITEIDIANKERAILTTREASEIMEKKMEENRKYSAKEKAQQGSTGDKDLEYIHDVRVCKCQRCVFTKQNPGMDWDKWNAHKELQKKEREEAAQLNSQHIAEMQTRALQYVEQIEVENKHLKAANKKAIESYEVTLEDLNKHKNAMVELALAFSKELTKLTTENTELKSQMAKLSKQNDKNISLIISSGITPKEIVEKFTNGLDKGLSDANNGI